MAYLDKYLIWIDPDYLEDEKRKNRFTTPKAYVDWVERIIASIGCSEVGRILLRSIKFHRKTVRISPIDPNPWQPADMQSASVVPGEAQDLVFNTRLRPVLNVFSPTDFAPIRAVVRFTPHWYAQGGIHHTRIKASHGQYTPTPESVLLHELLHAFRSVSNKLEMNALSIGGLAKYDAPEEFFAVLVENIYQSELKRNIRAHHQGFYNLDKRLEGSFEFFKVSIQAFALIKRFCDENPGLTRALAKVEVPFNPLAAFFKDSGKAKAFSASSEAAHRELHGVIEELTPLMPLNAWRKFF